MGIMGEYIKRNMSVAELKKELRRLIHEYNELRHTFLFLYVAAIEKPIPLMPLNQDDFYIIRDMLYDKKGLTCLDFYIETPGGRGETAEDIVRFLRSSFNYISYIVSGEAKSAGTIIVLSGDDILMTETGSLGPIDAQVKIGRSQFSAHDYMEWVIEKRTEAAETGTLNPFDAIMIAQITPGELLHVHHSLEFAKDLVVEWLINYKFKNWDVTESRQLPVTVDMKRETAENIANELCNHSKWRSHGRSLKADDLEGIGLKITRIDNDFNLSDIVYRIQTICRLIFASSSAYKIFATEEDALISNAISTDKLKKEARNTDVDYIEIEQECPNCGEKYKIYCNINGPSVINDDFEKRGYIPYPKNDKLICKKCGFETDLSAIRNDIESTLGHSIITKEGGNNG